MYNMYFYDLWIWSWEHRLPGAAAPRRAAVQGCARELLRVPPVRENNNITSYTHVATPRQNAFNSRNDLFSSWTDRRPARGQVCDVRAGGRLRFVLGGGGGGGLFWRLRCFFYFVHLTVADSPTLPWYLRHKLSPGSLRHVTRIIRLTGAECLRAGVSRLFFTGLRMSMTMTSRRLRARYLVCVCVCV